MVKTFFNLVMLMLLPGASLFCVLTPCYAQPSKPPAVMLEVDNDHPAAAESIRFRVSVTSPFEASRYDFDFGDGTTLWTESPEAEHAYEKEGMYRTYVRAVVNDNFRRSNVLVITVKERPLLPAAKIFPRHIRVQQGESVRFESRSTASPPAMIIRQEWTGPDDLRAEGSIFDIQTGGLLPDIYEIYLEVTDNYQQTDHARAILEIQSVRHQPPPRSVPGDRSRIPVPPDERSQKIPWEWILSGIFAGFVVGYLVREYLLKKPVIRVQSECDNGVQNIAGNTVPPIEGEIRLKTVPDRGEQTIEQGKVSVIDERSEDG